MATYPLYLTHMSERRAVVVGSGPATERKTRGLLDADAQVALVAPTLPAPLRPAVEDGALAWIDRAYRPGDLERAVLAIVTTDDPEVREEAWAEAQRRDVLINTTGDRARSTFANGACVRRGPLVVSVSTSGAAPTLSVRLREELEAQYGPEYAALLALMDALREPMQATIADFDERRARWYALLNSDVLDLLRDGRRRDAWDRAAEIVGPRVVENMDMSAECRPDPERT
jgi:siroheme synthase-like protein